MATTVTNWDLRLSSRYSLWVLEHPLTIPIISENSVCFFLFSLLAALSNMSQIWETRQLIIIDL